MRLLDLRSQTRLRTGISSTSDLSNADLDTQINQAYRETAAVLVETNEDFFEEQKTKFSLVANSGLYQVPSDMVKFKQLRLAYTTPDSEDDYKIATPYDISTVENVSVDEVDVSTSTPTFDITNNYFRINPRPTSSVTNGGEVYYIAMPSALAVTGDVPVVPVLHHDLISWIATKNVCFMKNLWEKYKVSKLEVDEGLLRMIKQETPRHLNYPERFRNVLETGRTRSVTELW